jgi:hypothetical protein
MVYKDNGGNGKIYLSEDNGQTWSSINGNISSLVDILSVTVARNNLSSSSVKHIIYVATDQGIYESLSNGESWSEISLGTNGLPQGVSYKQVLVDVQDTNIVYAIRSNGGVYRTVDRGVFWSLSSSISGTINDIDIVSDESNVLYVGLDSVGINEYIDPVRDTFSIGIESDGKITYFDFSDFEMGDKVFTDSNSIIAETSARNDPSSVNKESITFKVDDQTKYITLRATKKESLIDTEDIYIGGDLVNPSTNPFNLQNPAYDIGYVKINKMGILSNTEDFVISNKGIYFTDNNADT